MFAPDREAPIAALARHRVGWIPPLRRPKVLLHCTVGARTSHRTSHFSRTDARREHDNTGDRKSRHEQEVRHGNEHAGQRPSPGSSEPLPRTGCPPRAVERCHDGNSRRHILVVTSEHERLFAVLRRSSPMVVKKGNADQTSRRSSLRAGDRNRTGDVQLGKLAFYR